MLLDSHSPTLRCPRFSNTRYSRSSAISTTGFLVVSLPKPGFVLGHINPLGYISCRYALNTGMVACCVVGLRPHLHDSLPGYRLVFGLRPRQCSAGIVVSADIYISLSLLAESQLASPMHSLQKYILYFFRSSISDSCSLPRS